MIADRSSLSDFEQLNLDNRRECGCWSKNKSFNKFYSLNSSSDRSSASSLRMNHHPFGSRTDPADQLTQLSSANQVNPMNHLNHLNHLGHPMAKQLDDLQFDDYEQFFVPIESWETLDRRTKFTVYKLKVENMRSGIYWFVYRRFTDFQRLNDKLRTQYPNLDLSLPAKSIFENVFNPLFIEKRQLGLQLYLNRLMSSRELLKDLAVRRFLCIDEPPIASLSANDTLTYPSSVYSDSCDQLFACNNCLALERKLDQMQIALDEKDARIKQLESAMENSS